MRFQNRNRHKRWIAVLFLVAILVTGIGVQNSFAISCSLEVKVINNEFDDGINFILKHENGTHMIDENISKGESKTFTDKSWVAYFAKFTTYRRGILISDLGPSGGQRLREYNIVAQTLVTLWAFISGADYVVVQHTRGKPYVKKAEIRGCTYYMEIEPKK